MLNEIVNGIGLKLSKSFNGINIHKEELEQGFEEPCFFIDLLNPSEKQIIGNRYLRSYLFDIVYFPKKKSSEEIFEVLDKLYSVLEILNLMMVRLFEELKEVLEKKIEYYIFLLLMRCLFIN